MLKLRRQIRNKSFFEDVTEANLIKLFFEKIDQKHGVVLDIGASTGSFFENYLLKNESWKIYAFEPDPNPMKQEALEYFKSKFDVTVIQKACSNKSGEDIPFFTSPVSTGISSLTPFDSTHQPAGFVQTITLIDFINSSKLGFVDLLKIDTEGHDLFVLKGFPWDRIKPKVIMCEFENKKTISLGYTFQDLGVYLLKKGYKVFVSEWYPVEEYGPVHQWRTLKEFPTVLDDDSATGNFICFDKTIEQDDYFAQLLITTVC